MVAAQDRDQCQVLQQRTLEDGTSFSGALLHKLVASFSSEEAAKLILSRTAFVDAAITPRVKGKLWYEASAARVCGRDIYEDVAGGLCCDPGAVVLLERQSQSHLASHRLGTGAAIGRGERR